MIFFICKNIGFPIMSQNMDAMAESAICKESNISKKSQHLILRYLADKFGTCAVITETHI